MLLEELKSNSSNIIKYLVHSLRTSRERRAFHSGKKDVVLEKLGEQEAMLLEV
jgi:hypothetical protein